jgi:DNA-binding transcriptional ArsR family regulator
MNKKIKLEKIAKLLLVAGDASRLKILCVIFKRRQACVSEIAKELKVSVACTSHHLQVLSDEGILMSSRDGKYIYYSLSDSEFVGDLRGLVCKYK